MRPNCARKYWNALQEGDVVEEFGPLCEVQSDKAAVEITSRYAGTITRLHHQPGDMVQVGQGTCPILRAAVCIQMHTMACWQQESAATHSWLPACWVLVQMHARYAAAHNRCQAAQLACVASHFSLLPKVPSCCGQL